MVLRVLRTILGVALAIVRAPLLLFRRSSSSARLQEEEGRQQQQQQQRATTTPGAGGSRGKAGGAARRRGGGGGGGGKGGSAPAAAEPAPQPEEDQQPKEPAAPPRGVSPKSLASASRAAAAAGGSSGGGRGGGSGGGRGGGAPQAPPSASASPLHLSWLKGHGDGIASVSFSADGAFLLSASRDRGLRQWPLASPGPGAPAPLRRGAPPTPAQPASRSLRVSPLAAGFLGGDASRGVVVLSRDGLNGPTLTALPALGTGSSDAPPLWDASPLPLIAGRRPVALLCASSAGAASSPSSPSSGAAAAPPLIAVVSERTELETFDAATGRRTAAVDTGGLRTHGACCSSDGALFAAATFASDAKVYSFGGSGSGGSGGDGKPRGFSVQKAGWSLSHAGQVLAVSLSRDGLRAATSSRDGTWASWRTPGAAAPRPGERAGAVKVGAWPQRAHLPEGELYRLLSLSPDGSILAAAAGGDLHFLCATSGALLGAVSPAHGGEVTSLCWAPRRRKVAAAAAAPASPSPSSPEEEGEEERWVLASGGDDRAVRLWAAPEALVTGGGGGSGWQRG